MSNALKCEVMSLLKKILFFLSLLPLFLNAETLTLKEKLYNAEEGSFLVMDQNKTYTLLYIQCNDQTRVVLEEVSIPEALLPKPWMGWKCWFEQGAPGNTSWTRAVLHLESALFEEMYSFTRGSFVNLSCLDPFLTTLLTLPFTLVPEKERRHIGLPPGHNKPDHRPLWHPRLITNGCQVSNIYFTCWFTRWPNDGSELARKKIFVYLPEKRDELAYPTFFPYLVEIEGKVGSIKLRIIDSGTKAVSPRGCKQNFVSPQ